MDSDGGDDIMIDDLDGRLTRLEAAQLVCAERWRQSAMADDRCAHAQEQTAEKLEAVNRKLSWLFGAAFVSGAVCLAILGWLLSNGRPH